MKHIAFLVCLTLWAAGCKKIVDIQDPLPVPVEFCSVSEDLTGRWQSDSVWILTEVDTLDSLIFNPRPTVYYDLWVNCADQKEFLLQYTNYGGVVTRDVFSTNYESGDAAFYVYDHRQEIRDTAQAGFVLRFEHTSDSTMTARYFEELGQGQRSRYWLFFRKI